MPPLRFAARPVPLLFALAAAGCAATGSIYQPVARPAVDTPEAFLVSDGATTRAARGGEGCRGPMVDGRNDQRLTLVRSASGQGDYEVGAAGRYGVAANELLRLDCATGRPLGVVRR